MSLLSRSVCRACRWAAPSAPSGRPALALALALCHRWPAPAPSQPRRSAGHSRWQNVRADKEAGIAQKSSTINAFIRQLRKAVADGHGSTNQQTNVHLKAVFDRAKAENVPVKTLERLLAARSQEAVEPYVVELRGRGGICVLVQCNSPSKIKCRQDVASYVKKVGLEVAGVDSQISRGFFAKKGCVEAAQDPQHLPDLDRATEVALEFDCSDVRLDGDTFVFDCDPNAAETVADGMRAAGLSVLDSGVRFEPFETVEINAETEALLHGLYDKLREFIDGFIQVFDNVTVAGADKS